MSTHNIRFNIKRKSPYSILNLPLWEFLKGFKNEFETAVVDVSSVFEPLKFFCSNQFNDFLILQMRLHASIRRSVQSIVRIQLDVQTLLTQS